MKSGARDLPAAIGTELVALYGAAKWAQLVIAADRVIARYPRHILGWRAAGKALLQLGRLPEAIDRLTQVIKLAPGEADGYNDLGSAQYDVGRVQEAIASYRRAVELNPRSSEACSNLGRILCAQGQFKAAAECCQRAIDIDPNSAFAHNNLGTALSEIGRSGEAEASYRRAILLKPDYVEAIINLGTTLANLGRWPEAKATYRFAVQAYPNAGSAHNALGRLLSRLCEDDDEATQCLERAIVLNAFDTNTYVELGNILMRKREIGEALAMFRRARELQPLITWRANQEKAEFSALFLDTPMGGTTPVNYLAGRARYDRHFHCVIPGSSENVDLLRAKADVVFNMICNPDDGEDTLMQARDLVERLGRPTVNHPRLIMNTKRDTIARAFAGISGCVIPKTIRVAGCIVAEAARNATLPEFHLPLLVRIAGGHGGDDFDKCDNWAAIVNFVDKLPDADYYVIEYIDYRSVDGFFRKYRVIFVDGEIYPYHLAIHDDWKVHHFRTDMVNHAWMKREEESFLADIGGVFNALHLDALRTMATVTGLDYGGIDCGVDRDGRIVVFEANAAMLVHDEKTDDFAYKNPYIARIKTAFDAMLARRTLSGRNAEAGQRPD